MVFTKKQIKELKNEIDDCYKPLMFFDDDPDGLSSFLQLYNYKKDGKGVIVKSSPELDSKFVRKVKEFGPDKVFILDKPMVSQKFLDKVSTPKIWVDHHPVQEQKNVKYFNPRLDGSDFGEPTAFLMYQTLKTKLWVATVGCIGDWFIPPFFDKFKEKYPKLVSDNTKKVEDILFNSKLGTLVKIFSFLLKGQIQEVNKNIRVLTRIKNPYEILEKTTPAGKYLHRRYKKYYNKYEELLKLALDSVDINDKLIIFKYSDKKTSFTSDLSNEILYKFQNKIVLICREKSGEMKCSIRNHYSNKLNIAKVIEKALVGIDGYGGGHDHACGCCINVDSFDKFIEQFRLEIDKQLI